MLVLTKSWKLVYGDGEGDENKGGDDDNQKKATLKDLIEKHSLQEELNTMMSSNRKGLSQKNETLASQLTQLRDEATLTTQQRDELEVRIEELQTQFMGKEELAKRDAGKAAKDYARNMEKITGEVKKWRGLYVVSTTQRALLDAAFAGEADRPAQIVAMLGQHTHIVEELNDAGQGSGKYKPIVKFNDVDDDGNPTIVELSPTDTIKRMRELPDLYGNLFKGDNSGGLGGGAGAGGKKDSFPKLSEILKDSAKYQKWRKENPDLDVSKLRK